MADRQAGSLYDGGPKLGFRQKITAFLPEWQVFIRRRDGRSEHFTFTPRHQTVLLATVAALSLWAVAATLMLSHQPEELADKERRLEELMASYRSAEHRLVSAQKMVGDITHEIDAVHSNLQVLAETNAALAHDGAGESMPLSGVHVAGDPAYDDAGQPGGPEAKVVRDEVHRLEAALDRLKATYNRVVQGTVGNANQRINEAEHSLQRLGIDTDRLVGEQLKQRGRGGPFIPATSNPAGSDAGLNRLVERMERWDNIKATLQALPLAEPLHSDWEINSPFGARHDPLNNLTGVHEGVDLGAPYGTPVYATATGTVKMAAAYDRYGLTVDIDHGNGFSTRYAHLSRIKVVTGQKVTRNTVIGLLGATGRTTGAHLHYEVRVADSPRDPLKFISVGRDAPKAR